MSNLVPKHKSVMLDEVLAWLDPQSGQVFVDGTLGGGGHTRAMAVKVVPGGYVIALDRDPAALAAAEVNLAKTAVKLVESNYCELPEVLEQLGVETVDGVLLDLGLSSDQLADDSRGFSFDSGGPLDLRFNPNEGEPAARLVNRLNAETLADLIYEYSDERHSRRIARRIVERRRRKPIETAAELAAIVAAAVPKTHGKGTIHPATRTFQALRIAVNDELKSLEIGLKRIPDCLKVGGRFAVISFHSLEDRRVKVSFRDDSRLEVLTRKPLRPTAEETVRNPRSRSARLRVAVRR